MTQPLTLWDALDQIERTVNDLYVNRTVFSGHTVRVLVQQIHDMKQRVQGHPVGVRTLGQDLGDVERYHALRAALTAQVDDWHDSSSPSVRQCADRLAWILAQQSEPPR